MSNPFAEADRLRGEGALVQVRLPIIGRVWITTTQAALGAVLKDTKTFTLRKSDGSVTGVQWWMPKTIRLLANNMLTMDEPDHGRLRHLVDRVFRRGFVMDLEDAIQQRADELAVGLFEENDEADLVKKFARQLPLAVICEMLGLGEADRDRFSEWAGRLTSINGMLGFLGAVRPLGKMTRYLEREIERQRVTPGNGLIGELVTMQQNGEDISNDELVAMIFLLLIAGHETTTHVISGGVFELLRNREQRQWLLDDESRIPMAVEELLRVVSAVQFSKPRNVRRDITVEGVALTKGDLVMAMIVAANSDQEAIECPHRFDLSRKPNRHVSFGAGPHFCLGHQLARLEIACALKALFRRYPEMALAVSEDEIQWKSRVGLRALEALPVKAR